MGSVIHKCMAKSPKKGKTINEIQKINSVNFAQNSELPKKESNLNENTVPNELEIKKNENLPELSNKKEGIQARNDIYSEIFI